MRDRKLTVVDIENKKIRKQKERRERQKSKKITLVMLRDNNPNKLYFDETDVVL